MEKYNFKKTESWILKSKTFNIEVKHWSIDMAIDRNALSHKWNVYIYIFPNHPFFDKMNETLNGNYPFLQEFHYGCTYCYWERDSDGKITVKKYGSDYAHLHDEHFEDCDSDNHPYAREIFFDAERLYDSFKESEDYKERLNNARNKS